MSLARTPGEEQSIDRREKICVLGKAEAGQLQTQLCCEGVLLQAFDVSQNGAGHIYKRGSLRIRGGLD